MNKKLFFIKCAVVIVVAAGVYGYYLYNKPHGSAAAQNAAASLTAQALYDQYNQNEHAADSLYGDKVIEVKGILVSIDHNGPTDVLELSPQPSGGGVSCQMFPHDKGTTTVYPAIGSAITIKGKCTGFLMDVNLVDCGVE
jgi:tRNA_anti-like